MSKGRRSERTDRVESTCPAEISVAVIETALKAHWAKHGPRVIEAAEDAFRSAFENGGKLTEDMVAPYYEAARSASHVTFGTDEFKLIDAVAAEVRRKVRNPKGLITPTCDIE